MLRPLSTALAVALVAGLSVGPGALPSAAEGPAGPLMVTSPGVTPTGNLRAGTAYTGTVGGWSGTGDLSYVLSWARCKDPGMTVGCTTLASRSTSDPDDTLSYTPTAEDNLSEDFLALVVSASDSTGVSTHTTAPWQVRSAHTWVEPTRVGRSDVVTFDAAGAVTTVSLDYRNDRWGLYADRVGPDGEAAAPELVYARPSGAEGDQMAGLGSAIDAAGRVHLLFRDAEGDLAVTERDPGTGEWSAPETLAARGTYGLRFRDGADGGAVVASGQGRAAVAWVAPADDDDPEQVHVVTRGAGGWTARSPQVLEQPLAVGCPDGWLRPVRDGRLAMARSGDLTLVWARTHDSCPGSAWVSEEVVEAAYLQDGTWSDVEEVVRHPGFVGYQPLDLEASDGGAALALYREYFEGDSSNGRRDLWIHTAAAGGRFSPMHPHEGTPAVRVRAWADGAGAEREGQLDVSGRLDLVLDDAGRLMAAWGAGASGTPSTIEVLSGTLESPGTPVVVASRAQQQGRLWAPRVAMDDAGNRVVVFMTSLLGETRGPAFARAGAGDRSWAAAQTVERPEYPYRWFGSSAQVAYDASGRVRLAAGLRESGWTTGVSTLARGAGLPDALIDPPGVARPGVPVTLTAAGSRDPDGLALEFAWDLDRDGAFDDGTGETVRATFASGSRQVRVRVTATDGDRATAVTWVDVEENSAPWTWQVTTEGTPKSGVPSTYRAVSGDDADAPEELTYTWSFDGVVDDSQTGPTAIHAFPGGQHTVTVVPTDSEGASGTPHTETFVVEGEPYVEHQLTVVRTGNGTGTVTGPGIDCGTDCVQVLQHGSERLLSAEADPGSVLTGWTGCARVEAGDCTVVMDGARTVTATFGLSETPVGSRTLTVHRAGSGAGSVAGPGLACGTDCTAVHDLGSSVLLTATAAAGSRLSGWSGCDAISAGGTQCRVDLDADRTVVATFAKVVAAAVTTQITGSSVASRKRTATFTFAGTGGTGRLRFECRLDKGSWKPCVSGLTLKRLKVGRHTFAVRALDSTGTADATPATTSFKVKKVRPRR